MSARGMNAAVTVTVTVSETENENGWPVDTVTAECNRCGHTTESYGSSGASIRRCMVLLREECPKEENNFYKEA